MNQPKLTTSGKALLIFFFLGFLLLISKYLFLLGLGFIGVVFFLNMFEIKIKK